jgi:hypothetical protein
MCRRAAVTATLGVLGSLVLGLSSACVTPASPSAKAVLDTMRQLTVAEVLTKEAVQQAFEAELVVESGNDWVTYLKGQPRPGSRFEKTVKLVDLRVPSPQNDAMRDPLLVIELREDAGLTAGDAERVLGRPTELSVPEPNGVMALDYIYTFGPHRLWVGIGHGASQPLHSMAIHRNETR